MRFQFDDLLTTKEPEEMAKYSFANCLVDSLFHLSKITISSHSYRPIHKADKRNDLNKCVWSPTSLYENLKKVPTTKYEGFLVFSQKILLKKIFRGNLISQISKNLIEN